MKSNNSRNNCNNIIFTVIFFSFLYLLITIIQEKNWFWIVILTNAEDVPFHEWMNYTHSVSDGILILVYIAFVSAKPVFFFLHQPWWGGALMAMCMCFILHNLCEYNSIVWTCFSLVPIEWWPSFADSWHCQTKYPHINGILEFGQK